MWRRRDSAVRSFFVVFAPPFFEHEQPAAVVERHGRSRTIFHRLDLVGVRPCVPRVVAGAVVKAGREFSPRSLVMRVRSSLFADVVGEERDHDRQKRSHGKRAVLVEPLTSQRNMPATSSAVRLTADKTAWCWLFAMRLPLGRWNDASTLPVATSMTRTVANPFKVAPFE